MPSVSPDQLMQRLEWMAQQRRFYENKAERQGGLQRHEMWRHSYLQHPYLIGASDEQVAERFKSIFMNAVELTKEGKIGMVPFEQTEDFIIAFTHLLEEYEARNGGVPEFLVSEARLPIMKYFEQGSPPGIRMFEKYKIPEGPLLVKYGKRQHLESMYNSGRLRVANAKLYSNPGFLDSIRDDETTRNLFIPTYKERLQGKSSFDYKGQKIAFDNDDFVLPITFDDYYLVSLCTHVHHRMPTDFDADAAIVIKSPHVFVQKIISAFLAQHSDWKALEGLVTYYDPYLHHKRFTTSQMVPQMTKHIGYTYQKEFRIVFKPRKACSTEIEPIMISIGSMSEYADLVTL